MRASPEQKQRIDAAKKRMHGVFSPTQLIGRTLATGCAAVEITQRCNLDCSLCYLSEHSESVADIPIEEVFRRLDDIRAQYGAKCNVQITGGDPTLRKHDELIEIVKYARDLGLYPSLFTNGIAASRKLLKALAAAGLCDVAFHVDTTQKREGYTTEAELNTLRDDYLARARGLGLMVIFNTTIHRGNFDQVEDLVHYFLSRARQVGFASFQLQAETGRGEWKSRDEIISLATVRQRIERAANPGAQTKNIQIRAFPWELVRIGHPHCHSYLPTAVINGKAYPLVTDEKIFTEFLKAFDGQHLDRRDGVVSVFRHYAAKLIKRPKLLLSLIRYGLQFSWHARRDLTASFGRVHKLSFFVQNFMDAKALDQDRIDACSFMVMTHKGPVSMCEHNAHRDDYILSPITIHRRNGEQLQYLPPQNKSRVA